MFARLVVFPTVPPVLGETPWLAGTESRLQSPSVVRASRQRSSVAGRSAAGQGRAKAGLLQTERAAKKGVLRTFGFERWGRGEVKAGTRFEVRQSRRPPVHRGLLPGTRHIRFWLLPQPEARCIIQRWQQDGFKPVASVQAFRPVGCFRLVGRFPALWPIGLFGLVRNCRG